MTKQKQSNNTKEQCSINRISNISSQQSKSEMIILLSPTKTMKSSTITLHDPRLMMTQPQLYHRTQQLVSHLQTLSIEDIAQTLQVNEKLASQNHERYLSFHQIEPTYAIFSYQGLQYKALDVQNDLIDNLAFANHHVRILSGLYGVLKPLDGIVPYRLDFKSKISIHPHNNLYQFWNNQCYETLTQQSRILINLASQEYSLLVEPYLGHSDIFIHIRFLVDKNGIRKQEATAAKIARGLMARWIIANNITEVEKLKSFHLNDYRFDSSLSTDRLFVFIRYSKQ